MRAAALLLLVVAMPAAAAERVVAVTGFDRLRIETPVEVRVATGRSPGARLSGDDAALDGVELRQTGQTLILSRRGGIGRATGPVTVTLSTPALAAASVLGGGRLTVDRMKGARIDLSVGGPGTIVIGTVEADQLTAALVGDGRLTLSTGTARTARLTGNGAGTIDAGGVQASDLTVRLDGAGDVRAGARYTATIANIGLGRVAITGTPRCIVRASTGPVACGAARP